MKIKILGTRGEIKVSAPFHSRHSGVLINNTLLLDCGEPEFLEYKPQAILITHLHPDHAFFVRHHETLPHLQASWYAPEEYDHAGIIVPTKPFTVAGYHITPIPTIHSLKVKSQAYLIQKGDKKLFYTGDMIWIEKQYHHLLHNCDAIITEGSYIREGGMVRRDPATEKIYGHTGVPNLMHLFKQFTHTLVLMHFGSWFYKDIEHARTELTDLAHQNEITIIIGYDGLEITL